MFKIKDLKFGEYLRELKKNKGQEGFRTMLEIFWSDIAYTLYDINKIEKLKKFPPKVIENRILFETKKDFSGEGRIFYDYLIENGYNKKYEIIWLVRNPEKLKKYKTKNVRFVQSHQKHDQECRNAASYRYMLSSRYIFYDQSVNWIAMTRKNQVFVNLWHGCDYAVNADRKKIFFDHCLTPGEKFNIPMKEAFGCTTKKMLPLGYPHYDRIIQGSKKAEEYKNKLLKKSDSKQLILWYPVEKRVLESDQLQKLDEVCRQNKIHLITKNTVLEQNNITLTNITKITNAALEKTGMSIYELLHDTDALISDYSSVLIDYLLLNRPVGYLITELDEKKKWVFDGYPEFLPGEHIESFEDICRFIQDTGNKKDEYAQARIQTSGRLLNTCGNYSKRIADTIFTEE